MKFAFQFAGAGMVALAALLIPTPQADAAKIGTLTCHIEGGIGVVLGSSKGIDCQFWPSHGGRPEHYTGRILKIGADIGFTTDTKLGWAVFAAGNPERGALSGHYVGATAEVTIGVGPGANVLIGGFHETISLQPLSVQYQTGLNIAGGIGALTLEYLRVIK